MRIILCVTNDIATDQRISRIAMSLLKLPAEVIVVGTSLSNSLPVSDHHFQSRRFHMFFKKGPFFYAEYNIRLFFYLLFAKADILVANDLDTLSAVFLASRFRMKTLVYDSHEYFTELPELVGRPKVKRTWERIESWILPRIKYVYTVSLSIANAYSQKYNIPVQVVRNLPLRATVIQTGIPLRKNYERLIMYQGVLNMGRGLELAIKAMQFTDNVRLIIAGSGYFEKELHHLVRNLNLHEKVHFMGRIPPHELIQYTVQADLGISLEENKGLNYYFALPNKLFDYIQAQIPVLVSDLPEMAFIVNHYEVGRVLSTDDARELAVVFNQMLSDTEQRAQWKENLRKASMELCWENEESGLLNIYRNAINRVSVTTGEYKK